MAAWRLAGRNFCSTERRLSVRASLMSVRCKAFTRSCKPFVYRCKALVRLQNPFAYRSKALARFCKVLARLQKALIHRTAPAARAFRARDTRVPRP